MGLVLVDHMQQGGADDAIRFDIIPGTWYVSLCPQLFKRLILVNPDRTEASQYAGLATGRHPLSLSIVAPSMHLQHTQRFCSADRKRRVPVAGICYRSYSGPFSSGRRWMGRVKVYNEHLALNKSV